MRLLFRKNRLINYNRQSGRICLGFDSCLHPGSVVYSFVDGFKGEPKHSIVFCPFRNYVGPIAIPLSNFTRTEWKEFKEQHTLCQHPDELTPVREWRCFKCNAEVASERERHLCNPFGGIGSSEEKEEKL